MSRYARPSAGRSSVYSRSKFTNWAPYDPQYSEIQAVRGRRPTATFALKDGAVLELFDLPLHREFVRPFDCRDVTAILQRIPGDMLVGLSRIVLLGGTARQAKSAFRPTWAYGCYSRRSIYLFAYPRQSLAWVPGPLTAPEIHAYKRAGVTMTHEANEWVYRFTADSLRRFYMWDVLIHEIGHHVDRHHPNQSRSRAERFAEWFARRYGFEAEPENGNVEGPLPTR